MRPKLGTALSRVIRMRWIVWSMTATLEARGYGDWPIPAALWEVVPSYRLSRILTANPNKAI